MKKVTNSSYRLWLSWLFVALPILWGIGQTLKTVISLFNKAAQ